MQSLELTALDRRYDADMASKRLAGSLAAALSRSGAFGARTWCGWRPTIVNITIVAALLLIVVRASLLP